MASRLLKVLMLSLSLSSFAQNKVFTDSSGKHFVSLPDGPKRLVEHGEKSSCPKPFVPTSFSVSSLSSSSVSISFKESSSAKEIAGYLISRNDERFFIPATDFKRNGAEISRVDRGLQPATRYRYLIQALKACDGGTFISSPYSSEATVSTMVPEPSVPTNGSSTTD
jgi:hypothetical protein